MIVMGRKAASKGARPERALFVVFGLAENGRAKGACFSGRQIELALDAATTPGMGVYEAASAEMRQLAKQLPAGRARANGLPLVPFIRKALYKKLHEASGGLVRDRSDEASREGDIAPKKGRR